MWGVLLFASVVLSSSLAAPAVSGLRAVDSSHTWTAVSGVGGMRLGQTYNRASREIVDLGEHFVTALQVCTNGAQDSDDRKLKGVRMWGHRGEAGTWGTELSASFQRPNCREWAPRVICPTDTFATALRAYFVQVNTGFAGLALRCTRLAPR